VKKSIELTRQAGIRTIMITGDHVRTAQAIARELGLPCTDGHILDGQKLEAMSDDELQVAVKNLYIFARVDPKHKIRIVRALQANGEVTAMTGDGVNDAPALRGADIGVALGSGADVAKDVSDMIILDNDFSTIVAAIEEGRRIYQNIRKVVLYLLAGSFAEVVLIGGGLIAGLPLAVLPVQILWVNLIEDSFPNAALAFDKGDAENMKDKPRKKNEPVIDREMKIMITIISIVSNVALFGIYYFFLRFTNNIALTRTIIFVGLGIGSLLYVYSVRSMKKMIWQMPLVDNKYLTGAVLLGWVMLVGAVYLKPLQIFLRTVPLHWEHWVVLFAFGLMNVVLIEVVKVVFLARRKSSILNLQS
jgi:Ca2+-transporting ATPase